MGACGGGRAGGCIHVGGYLEGLQALATNIGGPAVSVLAIAHNYC